MQKNNIIFAFRDANATIPDKTTWEFFPLMHTIVTQQNYFHDNWFAVPNHGPLPPGQSCFLQTSKDQVCLRKQNNTATMFRKMLGECDIFSTVLSSKIVAVLNPAQAQPSWCPSTRSISCIWERCLSPKGFVIMGFQTLETSARVQTFQAKKKRFFNYARHIQVSKLALPKIDKLKLHHDIRDLTIRRMWGQRERQNKH